MHWLAVFSRFATFLPVRARVAPSLEKRTAVAAPIPELAPVIRATFPPGRTRDWDILPENWNNRLDARM